MSQRWLGTAFLRRASALAEAGRYSEALEALDNPALAAGMSDRVPEERFEYHRTMTEAMGALHRIGPMAVALRSACRVARDEMGDRARLEECWLVALRWAVRAGDWGFLIEECPEAIEQAIGLGRPRLHFEARLALAQALARTGQLGAARRQFDALRNMMPRPQLESD